MGDIFEIYILKLTISVKGFAILVVGKSFMNFVI